ncbi:MAG: DUF6062 family protein [Clostridia bacterium]|nr:DUF6062 family protein [Clostridia bacterium]
MKEKIYTIPVTDAFRNDCECPLCVLEKKLEDDYIEYMLGPSLMEPDCRMITNEKGFCRRHFEQLYNKQLNRLGLGLIIDTHMQEQIKKLREAYEKKAQLIKKEMGLSLIKNISNKVANKASEAEKFAHELAASLSTLERSCAVCSKLEYTMDRYIDVTIYLWFKEEEFKKLFTNKGFCLMHFKMLLEGAVKYISGKDRAVFIEALINLQLSNLERIQEEVAWFTKKFDYRYNDAPWGNSRDALPRSIEKLAGYCNLK